MLINYKNLENINDFQFLQKKQNQWYLCKESEEDWEKYAFVEDISSFLLQYPQFSKINESKIINLNFFLDSSDQSIEKLFVQNVVYKKYLASTKLAFKILVNMKKEAEQLLDANAEITEKKKIKFEKIKIDKIKFILRVGSVTELYFEDNSISYVYETLNIFESKLLQSSTFIRISRGCIINIEYISFFKLDNKKRFAELKIGEHPFKISRRLINSFKIKAINIT
jgi:DNA-binding LytR/AlgR family response regulator